MVEMEESMDSSISFSIETDPVPASRPRHSFRQNMARTYYTGPYKRYKDYHGPAALKEAYTGKPITGPVAVKLTFLVGKPKKTKLSCPKPDLDNYVKAVLDLMQPSVLQDDSQVVRLTAEKKWTDKTPHTKVKIQPL